MVDLHAHTTASDGTVTPRQLVTQAYEIGLSAIGITDHDTVAGGSEALEVGRELGIEVVPGIELSVEGSIGTFSFAGLRNARRRAAFDPEFCPKFKARAPIATNSSSKNCNEVGLRHYDGNS